MAIPPSLVSTGLKGSGNALAVAGPLILAVSAAGFFNRIPQGEVGIRTRWESPYDRNGDIRGIVRGRFAFSLPLSDSIKKVSVQENLQKMEELLVDRADVGQIEVHSSILWAIRNDDESIIKAYYRLKDGSDLAQNTADICMDGLRTVIANIDIRSLKDTKEIRGNLQDEVGETLLDYGAELRRLNLKRVARNITQIVLPTEEQNQAVRLLAGQLTQEQHTILSFPESQTEAVV